ncbi:prolyl-tRNA synthetase associated domain-containing protein [Aestuariirhabdus sp. Z084]|uniref:prolyl-tRNA synthetase associated domain-containing protein n=1 Tax=Aestuariirhabdus haliotis TaxID=2918751 RepID=UPI00201B3DA0|nr:prolyl-tRNA synthetase associated domain-containing protein [Aestuariirhabdus haliotis]MCL6414342.1 prolyl-tRNA synthetase associated domain-containing protein [Aestuariirhabdus haliotis]MCL6418274.1 prolyl-tRNA synthetase associated domain-containing protein [Aestuariirhabdus haliotis]
MPAVTVPAQASEPLCPDELFNLLKLRQTGIEYRTHEPVFTCEEATDILGDLPGVKAKNLFLKDRKGSRYILLCTEENRRADLKRLASKLDSSRLSMASNDDLAQLLGTEPGALSLLSLLNDPQHKVEAVIDADLQQADLMHCHPLSNRCTMAVDMELLLRLVGDSGHSVRWLSLES